ncbi:MBOAT family O-acyltransferase [Sporosalibacterium faouarense]|uniref:MBOAT family O-acyltransferase n=1 Tax=Sporosalibacterium faouarense TaxID=516123 RepID=UPI00141CB323|nr:MBOAT family protein [Sporosalibacterium faouarense]MTI46711.1 MBOAT family protein [Bacillota bacterium]
MLFHSIEFFTLLIITVILFYSFKSKRKYILAIANILFYAASGFNYLILFLIVAFISYYAAKRIDKRYGNIYFYIAIIINVTNLVFFKYTGFILKNMSRFFAISFPWENELMAKLILPVGISFYTFQLIAYIVDVKRKEIEPCDNFIKFWVFIGFFGQLIAGPIMRGKEFLPQITNVGSSKLRLQNFKYGITYILMGLAKKIIFADFLAEKADYYFGQINNLTFLDGWFAAYLFAFQIYFDFSAYSEIALGIGYLFGFKLRLNFKSPYISGSSTEFWRRWHITLSSWIKDYIYIPLGGSRKGFIPQLLFLTLAMMISGLWHGAAWTFIIWGAYHGLLAAGHKVYVRFLRKKNINLKNNIIYKLITIFVYFQLTTIGWVFFRADSFTNAIELIKRMLNPSYIHYSPVYIFYFAFIAGLYLIHVIEYYVRENGVKIGQIWEARVPAFIRAGAYIAILFILVLFTKTQQSSFIYFQF